MIETLVKMLIESLIELFINRQDYKVCQEGYVKTTRFSRDLSNGTLKLMSSPSWQPVAFR